MVYSLERLALIKRQEAKLEWAECFIETCANICGDTVYKAKKTPESPGRRFMEVKHAEVDRGR